MPRTNVGRDHKSVELKLASINACISDIGTNEKCRPALNCLRIGVDRKSSAHSPNDAIDPQQTIGVPPCTQSMVP